MKIALAIALIIVVAQQEVYGNQCPDGLQFQAEYDNCVLKVAGPSGKSETSFNLWIEHGTCIVKCMMNEFKILNSDGTINMEKALAFSSDCKEKHTEFADKIERMEGCIIEHAEKVDPTKKDCMGYHNLVVCLFNAFKS